MSMIFSVTPAKARAQGKQQNCNPWVPAFAGMTIEGKNRQSLYTSLPISIMTKFIVAFLAVAVVFAADGAAAEDFYKGKTITFVVGSSPGGTYDRYSRQLAEFWSRHIPGNPTIVIQNRPGAGSMTAANFVYNAVPKDGTAIGLTLNLIPLSQIVGAQGVKYDIGKMQWLGNMVDVVGVVAVSDRAPAITLEGAKRVEIVLGCVGKSSETYIVPVVMNALLGTKFKCVLGYPGISEIDLAIERGEVFGRGASWTSFVTLRPDWVRGKKIIPLVQIAFQRDPSIADVPLLIELATAPEDRAVLELVTSSGPFSRAPYAPPGVPRERIDILRRAFDAAMKDPEFLRTAADRKMDILPNTGEELEAIAARLLRTPEAQAKALKEALGIE